MIDAKRPSTSAVVRRTGQLARCGPLGLMLVLAVGAWLVF